MRERNGPGGMKTERRSPMITSGVPTPTAASNNMPVVITIPPTNPASKPARTAFVLLIQREYALQRCLCQARDASFSGVHHGECRCNNSFCRRENFPRTFQDHFGCDLVHAGMIKWALAQSTVIARRTRQVHAHDRFR